MKATPRPPSNARPRVYPSSVVAKGAVLGAGSVVGAFCFVADGARVGPRCRIQSHTSVWAGVTLAEDVFVGPAVVFTNVKHPRAAFVRAPDWDETSVGRGATLGAGCVLVAPVTVGELAMVGAGSVVTHDVPPHAIVAGNPARVVGWACACGECLVARGRKPPRAMLCPACALKAGRAPRRNGQRSRSPSRPSRR